MLQNCCCVSDGLERLGWLFFVKLVIWSSRTLCSNINNAANNFTTVEALLLNDII